MHIQSIPMWEGTGNNYAYIVKDEETKDAVVIDPANPPEVLPVLKELTKSGEIKLCGIVNTHHHHDHAGGNEKILEEFDVPIIGGRDCKAVTDTPPHNGTFEVGRLKATALHTPCHTQDSICYFFEDGDQKAVFTGDTLFIGGCGRFFEGNAPEMDRALNTILAALPDDTAVYPGHEYTKGNAAFALKVLPSAEIQALADFAEKNKQTQGKFTIGDEKRHNVFMMLENPEIQNLLEQTERSEIMGLLRDMKNRS